ncbi:MAG: hypothetical protein QOH84_2554 [Kribbellaceae bacterium]|nr:hypothetical protein [Kribbellaceae bacterium]
MFGIWYAKFNGAGWGNSVEVGIPGALSRCDNATAQRPAGCVFSNIPAVNSYSKTTVPDYVKHVDAAQLSGLPGRIGSGTVLHRLTSTAQQDANRAKACPASLPRPSGYSCDEYPMAATYEGASTGGGTLARSFSFCRTMDPPRTGPTGWSRCMIPATQNSSASGTYNQFVRDARMLDADPFQIAFIP